MARDSGEKLIANNKKAYHEYFIEEEIEAGIELYGTEVKSIRQSHCSIKEAYVRIKDGEAVILGMNVSPYEQGNIFNRDPLRVRRLLLHKNEIRKLDQRIRTDGFTIVPLRVYLKRGLVKVAIGLAKGKKLYDKRQDIAKKDARRAAEREYKLKLR